MSVTERLEKALSDILNQNQGCSVFLISLTAEIDGRVQGRAGIGLHFEDDSLPGGVRHTGLDIRDIQRDGVSSDLAKTLEAWVREINSRLKIPRPPRIEVYVAGV